MSHNLGPRDGGYGQAQMSSTPGECLCILQAGVKQLLSRRIDLLATVSTYQDQSHPASPEAPCMTGIRSLADNQNPTPSLHLNHPSLDPIHPTSPAKIIWLH